MRILYLSHTSELHGAGIALYNLVCQLKTNGYSLHVVIPNKTGPLHEMLSKLGVKCYEIPIRLAILPLNKNAISIFRIARYYLTSIFTILKLYRLVSEIKPDIIHSNVGPIHLGSLIAKITKIKHVWHLREFQDIDFGWKPIPSKFSFTKKINNANNSIIAVTKAIAQHYNLEINNVIYDGVFRIDQYPIIHTNKNKYFLFVGRLEDSKGISETISAFAKISASIPDYELWIAGNGSDDYIVKLKEFIFKNDLTQKVKFLGFRIDVYQLMSEATSLIVASKHEAFGFITAEAMYNGCLVIGRDTGGTKEQFDNGYHLFQEEIGIRFSTLDELAFSMEMVCKKDMSEFLKTLQLAQKTVLTLYSVEENAKRISKLYSILINNNH